jgi:thiol:disulfide interchange protein DsbD
MGLAIKKAERVCTALIFLFLLCLAPLGTATAAGELYALTGSYLLVAEKLYLAVTVLPEKEGVYLYASKSQTAGKPSVVSTAVGGVSFLAKALFPLGKDKADPWRAGGVTRVYEGAVTVYVSLLGANLPEVEARDIRVTGKGVSVRLDGLACSAVNCTPLTLYLDMPAPSGAVSSGILPGGLIAEPMPPFTDTRIEIGGGPVLGTTGRLGGTGESVTLPGAFLEKITPVPFAAHLEVSSFGEAVLLGFLAGLILNLMPCVLPVIGIKLASFFAASGTEGERIHAFRRHQIFLSLGVLVWFTCLAGLFYWLDLAWGQIFQSPVVVSLLALILLLLALSLFGIFTLPLIDLKAGNTKNPELRAFTEGFTATLLATPCGGPLLGGVLSWALVQPLGVLAVTLECVGLGMAFPYLMLAAFPSLAKRLPRPGRWMGTLEFAIGFLLLAAVTYFVSFLPFGLAFKAAFAVALVCFWLWQWKKQMPAKFFGAFCVLFSCLWLFKSGPADDTSWREYTHAAFEQVLGRHTVLVDFTADWCPTCKMVEGTALRESNLRIWEKEYGLMLFRVDMTRENAEGAALLKAVGSASIPVIAVFSKGESAFSPFVLRDVVTGGQIEEALRRASTRK